MGLQSWGCPWLQPGSWCFHAAKINPNYLNPNYPNLVPSEPAAARAIAASGHNTERSRDAVRGRQTSTSGEHPLPVPMGITSPMLGAARPLACAGVGVTTPAAQPQPPVGPSGSSKANTILCKASLWPFILTTPLTSSLFMTLHNVMVKVMKFGGYKNTMEQGPSRGIPITTSHTPTHSTELLSHPGSTAGLCSLNPSWVSLLASQPHRKVSGRAACLTGPVPASPEQQWVMESCWNISFRCQVLVTVAM